MKSINAIKSEIIADANAKIVDAVWDRVAAINSALDDAYGSGLGGHYASALHCAAEAVEAYTELIELCASTTEQPLREHLRDAVGSIKLEKFELPNNMAAALKKKADEAVNPGWEETPNFGFDQLPTLPKFAVKLACVESVYENIMDAVDEAVRLVKEEGETGAQVGLLDEGKVHILWTCYQDTNTSWLWNTKTQIPDAIAKYAIR